ncbi:MAG: TPM domain-containing protein [Candidatus Omnitrophica bacterium]|nr:TPM domain-containing protein [Candidatus Omnitrophota bacterium]
MRAGKEIKLTAGLLLAGFCAALGSPASAIPIPGRTPYFVNDYAGALSMGVKQHLETSLAMLRFETPRKIECVVSIFPSLDGKSWDEFLSEYIRNWRKEWPFERDNRVHFVVFVNERTAKIHVGYGVGRQFDDAAAEEIVNQLVSPELSQARYDEGVKKGVEAVIKVFNGKKGKKEVRIVS